MSPIARLIFLEAEKLDDPLRIDPGGRRREVPQLTGPPGIGRVVSRPLYMAICAGAKLLAFAGKFITWAGESKFCAGWKLRLYSRQDTIFVNNDFPWINKSSALKESDTMRCCKEQSTRMTDADIAMVSQYALRFDLIAYIAIRRWGDDLVTSEDSPALWAIDLADCHAHDVEERLRRVPGTPNGTAWQKLLCGLISIRWKQHQLTIGTMRGIGWTLYIEDNYQDTSHWGLELECIGEGYDDGYGTLESLTNAADSTARAFEQFENLVPAWMAASRAEQTDEREPE